MAGRRPDLELRVDGLKELRSALREVDGKFAKELGQAGKAAAEIVADEAKNRTPTRSGAARDSLRAVVVKGGGGVRGGGTRVPYFGFVDYGNKVGTGGGVGRGDSQPRPYLKGGRVIYPALQDKQEAVVDKYVDMVNRLTGEAGLT